MPNSRLDVAIIDYGISNLHSVQAACQKMNLRSKVTSNANIILEAKVAILPGVGAFGAAMAFLKQSKLDQCIIDFISTGKPFLGICLGMQLLFTSSDEFGFQEGLGLLSGKVKKFICRQEEERYPVPHIGWNTVAQSGSSWKDTFLNNNADKDFMYFVHSHYVIPNDSRIVLGSTTYGPTKFCSVLAHANIFATQFHPEKSGETGLLIYRNIKRLVDKQ